LFDERIILSLPIRDGRVQLPEAAVEGMVVSRALARELWRSQGVTDFDALPRPFAAVATDIRTGEGVVLRAGSLTEAIRASTAIPGLLEPIELGGRLLVDGGVVRNLPAEEARMLGAELLICSDVARAPAVREYQSMLDILSTAVTLRSQEDLARQYRECDVVLRPVSGELTAADFQALDTWIEIGRQAVREKLPEITGAFTSRRTGGSLPAFARTQVRRQAPLLPDSVYLREIRFAGLESEGMTRPALRALGLRVGDAVDAGRMDRAMAALQGTDLYAGVGYRILPAEDGTAVLEVAAEPVQRDRLGVGFRFDNRYKASVLLSATLQNRLGYGS
ncbi:MAG TPA: patatin-like phospholipase family protein, partial [Longimicrobiales bacterium]|nr:patatin-like phospholipase family protein [Longimicrobiales bacterium]